MHIIRINDVLPLVISRLMFE